jgi:pilus assembly protein CpaB
MNRNRLLTGMVFALVVALLTSVFVYRAFKQVSTTQRSSGTQSIVVAAQPLELGTRLDASKLRLIAWPSGAPMDGMYTRIEDCVNRALITSVAENEPILKTKVASPDSGAGLSATIPEGMRAISVAVNDVIGVAGFVTPGTMVDILVTGQMTGAGTNQSLNITRTILENVRVLAAGQKIEQDRDGKPQTVSVITVLVNPADATKLAMASTEGKIQLALRNTVDTKETNPPAILQSSLFTSGEPAPPKPVVASAPRRAAAPAPAAPPPPAPYTVEVITGTKREEKSFPNQ